MQRGGIREQRRPEWRKEKRNKKGQRKRMGGTSLVVQWLRFCTFNARGMFPHGAPSKEKKKKLREKIEASCHEI